MAEDVSSPILVWLTSPPKEVGQNECGVGMLVAEKTCYASTNEAKPRFELPIHSMKRSVIGFNGGTLGFRGTQILGGHSLCHWNELIEDPLV